MPSRQTDVDLDQYVAAGIRRAFQIGGAARVVGREALPHQQKGVAMISILIGILIICVIGAICFWAIDKFVNEGRLASLLKLLVVLVCLAAILQRVLPLLGINWL
jgi:hypothetical protein